MAASLIPAFWMGTCCMAVSWMAYLLTSGKSKFVGDFVKIEHVKKCSVFFLNLSNSKNYWLFCWLWESEELTLQQNSVRKNWMPEQHSRPLIHATGTPHWLLRPAKASTSSELTWLFRHSLFLFTSLFPKQLLSYLPITVQHLCDLQDTMPCQWSPSTFHPTLFYGSREIR